MVWDVSTEDGPSCDVGGTTGVVVPSEDGALTDPWTAGGGGCPAFVSVVVDLTGQPGGWEGVDATGKPSTGAGLEWAQVVSVGVPSRRNPRV